jgi:hypothetical protein
MSSYMDVPSDIRRLVDAMCDKYVGEGPSNEEVALAIWAERQKHLRSTPDLAKLAETQGESPPPASIITDAMREWFDAFDENMLVADGFDAAILGVAERCGQLPLVVYDAEKCIKILVERDHMSYEDAEEFFNFNTAGAWVGEYTPLFLWRYEPEKTG